MRGWWQSSRHEPSGRCRVMRLCVARTPAQGAGRQEEQGLQEGEQGGEGDADQPERQGEQPGDGPQDQREQGQGPAQDEQDAPGKQRDQCFHVQAPGGFMQGRKCGAMQVAILGSGAQPACDEVTRTGDEAGNRATKDQLLQGSFNDPGNSPACQAWRAGHQLWTLLAGPVNPADQINDLGAVTATTHVLRHSIIVVLADDPLAGRGMPCELALGKDSCREWAEGLGICQHDMRAVDACVERQTWERRVFGETVLESVLARCYWQTWSSCRSASCK